MKLLRLNFFVIIVILCANANVTAAETVVTINGKAFTEKDFQAYVKSRIGVTAGDEFPADKREQLFQEFINRELIYQDSLKNNIDQSDEFKRQLESHRKNLMTSMGIKNLLEEMPVTEEQLMQVYNQQVVANSSTEYHARHILLESEKDAKEIIIKLNEGGNFEELAREFSTGPSAADGGDLGWFAANQMVKPFADAVAILKKGKYSARPVQTKFGWHVIFLMDKRKIDPPSLHSVQADLEKIIQNELVANYIDELRQSAKIDLGK